MEHRGQLAASKMIESLNGWWGLAGVDSTVSDMPVDWLATEHSDGANDHVAATPAAARSAKSVSPAPPEVAWPSDIAELKSMVSNGAPLPGNGFGSRHVSPVGPANCPVMVISDLPDQDELAGGIMGGGATGDLLARMLAAIHIKLGDCYWSALATTIPPAGEVPESEYGLLSDFARHQIALVKPRSLLLLGATTCKAMLGEELMKARTGLRNINHIGSNMAVLTTFHPRTLIARPAMKMQAWQDLQMFAKGLACEQG